MKGLRRDCATCGHGYGVHQNYRSPIRIKRGIVEFFESLEDARQVCTGYPDMLERDGRHCDCRRYVGD